MASMASSHCWNCPRQTRHLPITFYTQRATFSTTQFRGKSPLIKKQHPNLSQQPPKFREQKNIKLKKKKKGDYKQEVTPELKALRKRIVLSNTNALAVPGVEDLSTTNMGAPLSRGKIFSFPGTLVDQLRALEAFKLTQNWKAYRRPSTLIRKENVEIGKIIHNQRLDPKTLRRVVTGERKSGKSVMLLQSMAMALLKGWIVISVPEASHLTNATTSYTPISNTTPTQYLQKHYISSFLSQILRVNTLILSNLTLVNPVPQNFPIVLREHTTLAQLADIGANDPELAWPLFNLLWRELTASTPTATEPRPPIFLAIDSITHLMTETAYRSFDFKLVHAHDLAIVNHLMSCLSGAIPLGPSGGIIMAATSECNTRRVRSFDFAVNQLLAYRAQRSASPPTGHVPESNNIPLPDSWNPVDSRVMEVMTGSPSGLATTAASKTTQSGPFRGVEVQKMDGLNKAEARVLMEYITKSGLLRDVVNDTFVGKIWTQSGGGIVGEVESALLRLRALPLQQDPEMAA